MSYVKKNKNKKTLNTKNWNSHMYLYNIHVLCSLIISFSVFTVCLQTTTAEAGESSSSQKFVSIINAENSFITNTSTN